MSALKFVGKHMKRHKGKIIISLVLSIVISLVSSLGPYIMKLIVDVGIPEGRIEYILILSSMAVAVYFLYSMGNFLLSYIFTLLSETVNLDIKKEIYNKLMYYPLSFFGNKEKGYILARTNEINSIKPLFSSTTCKLGLSIIEFVIASVFLFSINTSFTICIYLFLPIYFLLIKMMMNKTRYIVGKNMEEVATANGTIQQVLSGIEQVKISNKEKTESQKINNLNERISKLSTKQSVLLNLTSESIMLICNIISVLVLVISAIHISKNNMTMGDYFAFSGYLPKLLAPVQALASSLISIQPAIASLKRLVQYFSEKIEVENDLPYLNISNGQIVFENMSFKYEEDSKMIINKLSVKIPGKSKVLIKGRNGSGKTTLLKLIMKDSAYSGLYSEIAFIIGIAVIMIDTFFPPEETKVNCVWKIILIAVSIVCMLYFAKKVKTVNEVEEEKKFWPNFFIQWATSLGYINMPVAVIAILVTFDKGKAWTLFMMGVAVILTGLTLIEALVKTSKILKKENVGKRK